MAEAIEIRGHRKERVGVVISDVQDKTIVVKVDRRTQHPLYKKVVKVRKKFTAHDENNEAKVGDTVRILDGPLSSFSGTVESVDIDNNAVSVVVSMFGRETPVEFELDQVEVISQ